MTRPTSIIALGGTAVLGLGLWAFWLEPASLRVVEQRIDSIWQAGPSLRIAILTDLHVGSPFNGIAKVRTTVTRTNDALPDLICILGDLIFEGPLGRTIDPETIAVELSRLSARDGVVAVLGNNDRRFDGPRVRRALEHAGIRVLEDSAIRITTTDGGYWVAGVSDLWTGSHDVSRALASIPPDDGPILVITHNPDVVTEVPERVALTLAGHTHGGQVRFPLVGAPIVPSKYGQRFAAGLVIDEGKHLFVATGIGTSFLPVRFRVPPTIAVLTVGPHTPDSR